MLWRWIGCSIDLVPKELLDSTGKMSRTEVKELLGSIPLDEGVIEAHNEEHLVAQLFDRGICPIKIRPGDKADERIEKLKALRSRATMSTVKVDESILQVMPVIRKKNKFKIYFEYALGILAGIVILLMLFGAAVHFIGGGK